MNEAPRGGATSSTIEIAMSRASIPGNLAIRLVRLILRKMLYLAGIGLAVVLVSFLPTALTFDAHKIGFSMGFNWAKYWGGVSSYLGILLSGSFGDTVRRAGTFTYFTEFGYPVSEAIRFAFPRSLALLGIALSISVVAGIIIGLYGTNTRAKWYYGLLLSGVLAILSAPDFVIALLSQRLIVNLHSWGINILPAAGFGEMKHILLPAIIFSLVPTAYIARVTSVAMDGVLSSDYIRTAIAKGCTDRAVIYKHALRNAALRIIDSFPSIASISFANLAIVEYIFYVPGAAYKLIVTKGDVYLTAGFALCFALVYFFVDFMVSLMREFVDPRLKEAS